MRINNCEEVAMAKGKESQKLIANNKKAYHDFFIDETYECGIATASSTAAPNVKLPSSTIGVMLPLPKKITLKSTVIK